MITHRWIVPPTADIIEPTIAPTLYASGKPAVEWLGNGDVCFHLTSRQLPLEAANEQPQSVVVAHIIKPIADLPLVLISVSECLKWLMCEHAPVCGACPTGPGRPGFTPRIVG